MRVFNIHFSPCGSTYAIADNFCRALSKEPAVGINITNGKTELGEIPAGSIAVISTPVYGGRIPKPAAGKLSRACLKGVTVVGLAVYGGRAYEDALLEITNLAKTAGASVVAGAALLARHVFVPDLQKGRPDVEDFREIAQFGAKVLAKIESGDATQPAIPGNHPYCPGITTAFVPFTDETFCRRCKNCVEACPTGAINRDDIGNTDPALCIDCMRCVDICEAGARSLPAPAQKAIFARLSPLIGTRKANEFFI